ncbi:MAG: FAD-dependent oxidoreductase [Candidatus Melainabacteria bacterium]|nr:FAD-dependent oxidoreductase [Candidatus Melainabacteria bacterium]
MKRVAIIGCGISGLGLAYYLRDLDCQFVLYEMEDYLGGHANTVMVDEGHHTIPVDTGFMVFNKVTYPLLLDLFKQLNVPIKQTDMSFSVQDAQTGLQYAGASFNRLFGDRSNFCKPFFLRLLLEINRFNCQGKADLLDNSVKAMSLAQYVQYKRFSKDFVDMYLVPMSAAIWSAPPGKMMDFPASTLLHFFANHGLLGVSTQHQWWTVDGGSRQYVKLLLDCVKADVRKCAKVVSVERKSQDVMVNCRDGDCQSYDQVIMACHADQALALLSRPSTLESSLLSAFSYQQNHTILHTDSSVMPKAPRCWASWNYRIDSESASTHYWMNNLQNVSQEKDYFVSLNAEHLIDKAKIVRRIVYHHPLFDKLAISAQSDLARLNNGPDHDRISFCGSYFGYGFHEDGLKSAWDLAQIFKSRQL